MLTILYPQLVPIVQELSRGLLPISISGESHPKLIIKSTKEMLLAAKMNLGFKIYVSPITLAGTSTVGLISAFFDNEDEPLVIFTPLFEDDFTHPLLKTLTGDSLDVHFFDEINRELLGYSSKLECTQNTKELLAGSSFCKFDLASAGSAHDQMRLWFGYRSQNDDLSAISIKFVESLIPDDLLVLDTQPENHSYQGSSHFSFSQLEREEPGAFQERDIAHLLKKLFFAKHIYMNPLQTTNGEEIADILVITEAEIIVIQAKDSPNTERVLKNAIDRKKATARKSLLKALSQTKGAIRYLRSTSPLKMIVGGENVEIDISGRNIRSLVVVKELFDDEYPLYSQAVLELSKETQVPCITLDYPELHMYMTDLSSDESFFVAFDRVFSHGIETGTFPRLRIWNEAVL